LHRTPPRSLSDGTNSSEPNNIVNPPEYCGLANFTMASGNDTHIAWGWADESCDKKYTYMCKVSSEWRWLRGLVAPGLWSGCLPVLKAAFNKLRQPQG
jgi:hypothetical protein